MERDRGLGRPEGAPKKEDRALQKEQGKASSGFPSPQTEPPLLEEGGGEGSVSAHLPHSSSTPDIASGGQEAEPVKPKKPCPQLPFPGGNVCILYGPKNHSKNKGV
jgi:hypothetical protein